MRNFLILALLLTSCSPVAAQASAQNVVEVKTPRPTARAAPIPDYYATGQAISALSAQLTAQAQSVHDTAIAEQLHVTETQSEFLRFVALSTISGAETQMASTATSSAKNTQRSDNMTATPLVVTQTAVAAIQAVEARNKHIGDVMAPIWAGVRVLGSVAFVVLFVVFLNWLGNVILWKVKYPYGVPEGNYIDAVAKELPPPEPARSAINIYHKDDNGGIRRAEMGITLPCSDADMTIICQHIAWDRKLTIPINFYQREGLSGRIEEIREWFVKYGYGTEKDDKQVSVTPRGEEFARDWVAAHNTPLLRPEPTKPVIIRGKVNNNG